MKTIKFLQESFETKERFQQEISIKYSYNFLESKGMFVPYFFLTYSK